MSNKKGLCVCHNVFHRITLAIRLYFIPLIPLWFGYCKISCVCLEETWTDATMTLCCFALFLLTDFKSLRLQTSVTLGSLSSDPKALCRKCLLSAKQTTETGKPLCEVPVLLWCLNVCNISRFHPQGVTSGNNSAVTTLLVTAAGFQEE